MKPLLSIILCALCAGVAFGLFLYQSGSGKLSSVLGKPAIKEGETLFYFQKKVISKVSVTKAGETNTYTRLLSNWSTKRDGQIIRADYNKIDQLLYLLETAKVIKALPSPPPATDTPTEITITSDSGKSISTTLVSQLPRFTGLEEPLTPAFLLRKSDGRYYACTSELKTPYPDLKAQSLTDHRPFFFHPDLLAELSYEKEQQTITLSRKLPQDEWRITAPLNLRTNPEAVKEFITHLFELEAAKLTPKTEAPTNNASTLTLKSFSTEIPPQTLNLNLDQTGFLQDQPFSYHFSPEILDSIIPSIDNLRSKKLAKFSVGDITSILLQSKTQPNPVSLAILPTKTGAPRWMYQTTDSWIPASEIGVSSLLTALTQDSVSGFSLETIKDSLDADKSITVSFKNRPPLHFDLLRTAEHTLIQRKGDSFAAILSSSHAKKFQTEPTAWKDNRLWNLSSISLRGLQRQIKGKPVEVYSYNFNLEQWKGKIGNQDIDEDIDLVSANAFLNLLETLRVERWIPAGQAQLSINDSTPGVSLIALSKKHSELGEPNGLSTQTLELYRMPGNQAVVIACLKTDNNSALYGLIDKKVALRLTSSFVYQE